MVLLAKRKPKIEEKFGLIPLGSVRTRFAPSPTGFLHIGSVRTALFNYLFAKKHQGSFVLRIEDTDEKRSKDEFEKDIIENLIWLGIEWDEGPIATAQTQNSKGKAQNCIGNYGPYRQSERKEIYKNYFEKLLKEGKAYYCFCSQEELEARRQYQESIGIAPRYDGKCANLSSKEVEKNLSEGKKAVIRLKVPEKKVQINDMIRGLVEFDTSLTGDFVIAKDLLTPVFHFSVVADDFEMKISHVIRGEEHLSNTPKHIIIQEALGFPTPIYAHLPLILAPDKSKLSKRHGSVAVSEYRKEGYLPEAIINMLAFLGWNPGTEQEIYFLPALVKDFSIEKVQKGGAVFDINRLNYLNGFYIRQKSIDKLTELCIPYLIEANLIKPLFEEQERFPNFIGYFGKEIVQKYQISETKEKISFDYLAKIVLIYKERLKKLSEIIELTDFFFKGKLIYDKNLLKWKEMESKEIIQSLDKLIEILSKIKNGNWKKEFLEKILTTEAEEWGTVSRAQPLKAGLGLRDRGKLLWPLRVALTGKKASAGPFEIAEILGKEKTLSRLQQAKE